MMDSSEKRKRQLTFKLQHSRVFEKRSCNALTSSFITFKTLRPDFVTDTYGRFPWQFMIFKTCGIIAESSRAKRASGAPWVRK